MFSYSGKINWFFPEREKAIIEYIKILDDSRLIEVIHEKAQKALANKNESVGESIEEISFVGKKCSVLSNNIMLNELLIKLGEQIKATQFLRQWVFHLVVDCVW